MAEIKNYAINFSYGVTLAAQALACTEINCERALHIAGGI
jgi:hypothetical protein